MVTETKPERTRIRAAFRELRKQGINARMNFACCSSCGHYELAELNKPYCFWNQQAEKRSFTFNGEPVYELVKELRIQFSDLETANKLVEALKNQRLTVVWNGTEDQAVGIIPDPAPDTVLPESA